MKLTPLFCVMAAVSAQAASPGLVERMEQVADYQLAHPPTVKGAREPNGWVLGAFYAGLSSFDRSGLAGARYHPILLAIAEKNHWKPGPREYHADDQCVGQTYLDLYDAAHDPKMIAAFQAKCDHILAKPATSSMEFVGPHKNDQWSWCDSLFMGPPGWVHLSEATGNPVYRDYAVKHWWMTSDFLYDQGEHLYYRDSTYFNKREPNGQKVFWSRGNGWVLAGIARLLDHLPATDPARPKFEAQFKEMAERVRGLQLPNGGWASSLLDPQSCKPALETSGTGFYCFAFAWGIHHGLLPAATFGPAAERAWAALNTCVEPSGRMNHVQPIGAAPTDFPATATEAYGPGAYLLAGVEVERLVAGFGAGGGASK